MKKANSFHRFCLWLGSVGATPNCISLFSCIGIIPTIPLWIYGGIILKGIALIWMTLCWYCDRLDGCVARTCNMVSESGKIIDPLCDKIRFYLPMFSLIQANTLPGISPEPIVILLFLDTISTVMRGTVPQKNTQGANYFGKAKTFLCATAFFMALAYELWQYKLQSIIPLPNLTTLSNIMFIIAIVAAILSLSQRTIRKLRSSKQVA